MKLLTLLSLLFLLNYSPVVAQEAPQPFTIGEKLLFDISKLKVKVGEASVELLAPDPQNYPELCRIIFSADAPGYVGTDTIYVDCDTFYPQVVVRDIAVFGRDEKIVETYDQQTGRITVEKHVKNLKPEMQLIEKNAPVDNLFGFIYRFRQAKALAKGDEFQMNLPTKDVRMKIVGQNRLSGAGKIFDVWVMQSKPSQFKVWMGMDEHHYPVKIYGAIGVGGGALVLREIVK